MHFVLFNVMSRARTTKDLREMFIFNLCDAEQRKDEDYDDVVEENLLNEVPVLCLHWWLFVVNCYWRHHGFCFQFVLAHLVRISGSYAAMLIVLMLSWML